MEIYSKAFATNRIR